MVRSRRDSDERGNLSGNRSKGIQKLEDIKAKAESNLIALDGYCWEEREAHGYGSILKWYNEPEMFTDDNHPLYPECNNGLEQEAAETIVFLCVIEALQKAGCERRQDAVKMLENALGLKNKRAGELFKHPHKMDAEQATRTELLTHSKLDDLRGINTDSMRRREVQREISRLQAEVLTLRGERLKAALEIVKAARGATCALKD